MMFMALSFYGIFMAYLSYEEVMSVRIYAQYAPTIIFIIFLDFLMFYQVFFHHKWNDAELLLINMVPTICLMSSRTT